MTDYKISLPCGTVIEGPNYYNVFQMATFFDERYKWDDETMDYVLRKHEQENELKEIAKEALRKQVMRRREERRERFD